MYLDLHRLHTQPRCDGRDEERPDSQGVSSSWRGWIASGMHRNTAEEMAFFHCVTWWRRAAGRAASARRPKGFTLG